MPFVHKKLLPWFIALGFLAAHLCGVNNILN
jgi:hypothetical protein